MTDVPSWWQFLLLSLAVFRIYRLIAEDTILDRPRRWLLRLGKEWQRDGDAIPDGYREKWALFITCPACCGFWVGILCWVAWLIFPTETIWVAVPFALNEIVIITRKQLDQDEES